MQLFHPSLNTVGKWLPVLVVVLVAAASWGDVLWHHSSWATGVGRHVNQDVPFSHEHHVRGLGLDCRYCHAGVETSAFAGMPPTKTCMTCHSQIWRDAPMLKPVRDSWLSGQPMRWTRVNDLPGYVFFDHSAHVQKGVGCSTCHGNIALMPLTTKAASLQMQWCLECHRAPEQFLRPRDQVFNVGYQTPPDQLAMGKKLVKEYHVLPRQTLESCSTCHH